MPPKRHCPTAISSQSSIKKPRTSTPAQPAPKKPLQKLPPLENVSTGLALPPVAIDPRAATLAREILSTTWGYPTFRLAQEEAIARLISGGSAVVVFPTGGGKSLVYQVPALAFDSFDVMRGGVPGRGLTLVVSPLIALMKDQTEALKARGVKAASLDSSQTKESVLETYRMLRNGELKLLYVAPERLNNEAFVELIKGTRIRLVAVDEAHCISEWGHAFRPDYLKVARFVKEVNAERVLCLTATATPKVAKDILSAFNIPDEGLFRTTTFRPNLKLLAIPKKSDSAKLNNLKAFLSENPGPSIVYVITQQQAMDTSAALSAAGYNSAPYHAGLPTDMRSDIQNRFMNSDDMIIAATIAFGMGVDKANIRSVVHYTLPKSLEGYSQEIGRAGRDGLPSTCLIFLCSDDIHLHESYSRADVPSLRSVQGCLKAFFEEFPDAEKDNVVEANMQALGKEWDIRPTTLSLLFAQLELRFGLLRAITPKYNFYTYTTNELFSTIDKTGPIQKAILIASRKAVKLTHIDVEQASNICGRLREEVVGVLQSWERDGAIQLKPSGVINRFRVLNAFPNDADIKDLAHLAHGQMETRERDDMKRLKGVVELLAGYECFSIALAAYFGDELENNCRNCSFCETLAPVEFDWPET